MVVVELTGDVTLVTGRTVINLIVEQVGQSLVVIGVVLVELGGVTVAGMLDTVFVEFAPGILMGGQVGQG